MYVYDIPTDIFYIKDLERLDVRLNLPNIDYVVIKT